MIWSRAALSLPGCEDPQPDAQTALATLNLLQFVHIANRVRRPWPLPMLNCEIWDLPPGQSALEQWLGIAAACLHGWPHINRSRRLSYGE